MNEYELCDTLFYSGIGSSQTQILNYVGDRVVEATTGEFMWSTGYNNLPPLNVIYNPYIGKEVPDVNLNPYASYLSLLNPVNAVSTAVTWQMNNMYGRHFLAPITGSVGSVKFHVPNFTKVSIGQEVDMDCHREKYELWLNYKDRTKRLILWGVSRGTAATFCAYAEEKYPEVALVVLEGAIDSIEEVLPQRFGNTLSSALKSSFAFFNRYDLMQYRSDGPSPIKSVPDFPADTPVVFITSDADKVVTRKNTETIANALASRGKNDVYCLVLEDSSHPCYAYSNEKDHRDYETFMHAIYKKYELQHEAELASEGEALVEKCQLYNVNSRLNIH